MIPCRHQFPAVAWCINCQQGDLQHCLDPQPAVHLNARPVTVRRVGLLSRLIGLVAYD